MDRHPVRHGRPPTGIGAGVEAADEFNAHDAPGRVTADAAFHLGRVAFRRRGHAFLAAVDHPAGPPGFQRHKADQRLQRHIQFRAEPAARGRRQDAHTIRRQAKDGGGIVAVHHRGLGAGADAQNLALHPGRARLGFNIGVFDIGGLEPPLDHMGRCRQRRHCITLSHLALDQQVLRPVGVQQRSLGCLGLGRGQQRRKRRPADRKGRQVGLGPRFKGHQRHTFPAKPRRALGDGGLVGKGRDDGKGIAARNVGGGKHGGHAGAGGKGGQIAKGKGSVGMGRANGLHHKGPIRHDIGAKEIARDLGRTVQPVDPRPDRRIQHRFWPVVIAPGVTDGGKDLAIAGAATQHAPQRLFGFGLGRAGGLAQKLCRRHQHTRRADATLRRPMAQEGGAQARQNRGFGLDRFDAGSGDLRHRHQTGTDLAAIDQNGAGAAIPCIAAHLGAALAKVFPQRLA